MQRGIDPYLLQDQFAKFLACIEIVDYHRPEAGKRIARVGEIIG
jgi:hypothetical protein